MAIHTQNKRRERDFSDSVLCSRYSGPLRLVFMWAILFTGLKTGSYFLHRSRLRSQNSAVLSNDHRCSKRFKMEKHVETKIAVAYRLVVRYVLPMPFHDTVSYLKVGTPLQSDKCLKKSHQSMVSKIEYRTSSWQFHILIHFKLKWVLSLLCFPLTCIQNGYYILF